MDLHIAKKLLGINATLTEHMEVNQVLRKVVQVAAGIIDRSEVLILYLYDEQSNRIKFSYGVGVNDNALKHIKFLPGESIVGKIFVEQKPKLFQSEHEIDQFMQDMRKKNFELYFEGVYKRKIKSTFCVPIVSKGRCYGVVIVNNFSETNAFTKDHMDVIQVIADHSAIALDNSTLYQHMKEKNELLSQSVDIHNKFYHLMLEGQGIEQVLQLLSRMIQSPVRLMTDQVEDEFYYFPIIRNKELLGYLQLVRPFHTFSNMEQIAIEQASFSIALEQMKQNELFEKEIQFREETFGQMIENVSTREWERMVHHLQWERHQKMRCIILEGNQEALWNPIRRYERERFVQRVEKTCEELQLTSLAVTKGQQLILIMPQTVNVSTGQFKEKLKKQLPHWNHILFGIGRDVVMKQIRTSYDEALQALTFARKTDNTIVYYERLGFERLIDQMEADVLNRFVHDKLKQLIELGEIYVETLQAYIQENKQHKQTAEKLHIHQNTLYIRLRKIEEVLQINLHHTENWMNIVIAMMIYVDRNN